jgi:uncharacterized protein (TIGR02453 family)
MNRIILDFLTDLRSRNDREWFQSNKDRYNLAKKEFETFIDQLIPELRQVDPLIDMVTAKDCVFRIFRDVRFSSDKSPYKTNMGAYIARGGRKSVMAGYYVHVEPGGSFLAGGIYMPQPDVLKMIRQEIHYHFDDFDRIISAKKFRETFGQMEDEGKMKTAPRDFPKDFAGLEYLKYRSFAVMHPVGDELVLSADYVEYAREVFTVLHPLNVFFNKMFA